MENRSHLYRRVADAAAQDVANWPTWKRNATQVPLSERRSPEIRGGTGQRSQDEKRRDG
jgi:hypothetical protein